MLCPFLCLVGAPPTSKDSLYDLLPAQRVRGLDENGISVRERAEECPAAPITVSVDVDLLFFQSSLARPFGDLLGIRTEGMQRARVVRSKPTDPSVECHALLAKLQHITKHSDTPPRGCQAPEKAESLVDSLRRGIIGVVDQEDASRLVDRASPLGRRHTEKRIGGLRGGNAKMHSACKSQK